MYVKVQFNGVSQYIPAVDVERQSSLRTTFNAEIETDEKSGKAVRYTVDDLNKKFAQDNNVATPEDIFGLKPIVIPSDNTGK